MAQRRPSTAKQVRSALRDAAAGAEQSAHFLLDAAESVDNYLRGKRGLVVFAVSFAMLAAQYLGWRTATTAMAVALFVALVAMVLARVGACRDDDGAWSVDLVVDQLRGAAENATSFATDLAALPLTAVAHRVGRIVFGLGVVMMATTIASRALHMKWMAFGRYGLAVALVGVAMFSVGWWKLHGQMLALRGRSRFQAPSASSVLDGSGIRPTRASTTPCFAIGKHRQRGGA
ncbi:MAG: hypothetical protein FJ100_23915, partial [Deltaproteobacteria bacterium]|nr:hypothetical protein [Deltaproteobacteria bacterium]